MLENLETLDSSKLISKVLEFRNRKYRFVTITAVTNSDLTVDLIYSFEKGNELYNLKITSPKGGTVESITEIYLAAAFAENEIIELFGLKFSDLVLDYGGHFMLEKGAPESPFGSGVIIERVKK